MEESSIETFRSSETSIIYASNNKPIVKLRGDKDSRYLEFKYIPQEAIDCMVVTEDKNYYEHSGVSILSFSKAAALYIKAKVCGEKISRGGSTITQQLAKNAFLSNEKTEERKIREIFLALELEQKYTKDEIMEFYLNTICFANGHFGIEAASLAYFSKSVKELDLAEIAFLCAIPNRPTYYDPLDNFDATNKRKELILKQLLEEEKISEEQYNTSICEEIVLKPEKAIENHDYMTTYAIFCFNTYENPLQKKTDNTDQNETITTEQSNIGDRTETPVVTEKPTVTKKPVVTEQPDITDKPVEFSTPTIEPVKETDIEQDDKDGDSVLEEDSEKDSMEKEAD